MKNLWTDEAGAVLSIELVLVATIVGLGAITGLTSLRDGVITELADVGGAIAAVNQSYEIGGTSSHCSFNAGSTFTDMVDFCDDGVTGNECNSRCLIVCEPGTPEVPHGTLSP